MREHHRLRFGRPLARFAAVAALLAGLALPVPGRAAASVDADVAALQHDWAVATYQTPKGQREAAFKALSERAAGVSAAYPGRAEPLVWQAIVLAGYADALGGIKAVFAALPMVKQARDLLLEAERRDPTVLDGSVYTSLGSLYYMVPGWPIGFGDPRKARVYLDKAVAAAPQSIDANYFMGDFLLQEGDYKDAAGYLEQALDAPPRPGREIADQGRRAEARADLAQAQRHLK
jgi:tetratricopeptide (TPR) repeat protein